MDALNSFCEGETPSCDTISVIYEFTARTEISDPSHAWIVNPFLTTEDTAMTLSIPELPFRFNEKMIAEIFFLHFCVTGSCHDLFPP